MDPTLNNNTAFYKKISTSLPDPLEERFFYKICRLQCHERKKRICFSTFFSERQRPEEAIFWQLKGMDRDASETSTSYSMCLKEHSTGEKD